MKTAGFLLLMILSIFGIADTSYITWEKMSDYIPPCQGTFRCEEVLRSKWSTIGPVPVSALGILFYTTMLILSICLYLGISKIKLGPRTFSFPQIQVVWGVGGAAFSLYLISIMGLVLHAWCIYCLFSAITTILLCSLSIVLYRLQAKELSHED